MTRLARALDSAACSAADEAIYAKYKGEPRPNSLYDKDGNRLALKAGDPLCSEWIELYLANGGKEDKPADHNEPEEVPTPCPKEKLATLAVQVVTKRTGDPIEGAKVNITGPESREGKTEKDGWVKFEGIAPGTYDLIGDKDHWKQAPGTGTKSCPPSSTSEATLVLSATVDIRIIDDGGVPAEMSPAVKAHLRVSDWKTDLHLPTGWLDVSTDRRNFKVDVLDENEGGDTVKAKVEVLKNDDTSFATKREVEVECKRLAGTDWFRSKYLRLVVDDIDDAEHPDQTILTDWDSTAPTVEILGQKIHAKYSSPARDVETKAEVTEEGNRRRLRLAAHILRTSYGTAGSGIVTVANVQQRTNKWYRRLMAQCDVAPTQTVPPVEVDPPRNMIVISDISGAAATGNAGNRIRFFVKGAAGFRYTSRAGDTLASIAADHGIASGVTIWDHANNAALKTANPTATPIAAGTVIYIPATGGRAAVVHYPAAGATPQATANALAAVLAAGGYAAPVFVNKMPAGVANGSADIVVKTSGGALVEIETESSADTTQTIVVARVNTANFEVSSNAAGFAPHVTGGRMQRALARNYRTANDTIECFVIGNVNYDDGSTAIRGRAVASFLGAPQLPYFRTTYMKNTTMDGTDNNPFTFPHESGHVAFDIGHVTPNDQMMRSGTSGANAVDASKRIADRAVAYGTGTVNQQTNLRAKGAPVLGNW